MNTMTVKHNTSEQEYDFKIIETCHSLVKSVI